MTSQIEELNIDELKAEAKALGLTGWQAMKDPNKLLAKIEEFKAGGAKRSKAPKMQVATLGENEREKMLAQLEKDDPDCKYLTQNAKISPAELAAKGMEVVKKADGSDLYCKNDIVVRTDKESYTEWQNKRTEHSLQRMRAIDKDLSTEQNGQMIQAVREQAKTGRNPE